MLGNTGFEYSFFKRLIQVDNPKTHKCQCSGQPGEMSLLVLDLYCMLLSGLFAVLRLPTRSSLQRTVERQSFGSLDKLLSFLSLSLGGWFRNGYHLSLIGRSKIPRKVRLQLTLSAEQLSARWKATFCAVFLSWVGLQVARWWGRRRLQKNISSGIS